MEDIWTQICEMAYYGKNITDKLIVQEDYELLEDPTLDSVWEKFSNQKDEFGKFIEPQVVPELVKLHVPYALFHCLGVNSWFEHSFPNCVVSFWEV